jgi:TRAP-type C4-dicarboxylate transport system permease small subunit
MNVLFQKAKAVAIALDKTIETFAVSAVALMTIIVTMQVVTRKVFNFVFFWSEEITLLLLIWFSFLGIAIGFRERLHLAMDALANRLPAAVNRVLDKLIDTCTLAFGLYLVVYGWQFTALMHANRMSATEWPSSVMYVIMPITGMLICIYSVIHLCGIELVRHKHLDEGLGE